MAYNPPNTDVSTTGTAGANGVTFASLALNGQQTLSWYASGTFVASYQVQLSVDGTNFLNYTGNAGIYISSTGATNVATMTVSGVSYHMNVAGYSAVRFITTAYTSGTISLSARGSYSVSNSVDGIAQTNQQGVVTVVSNAGTNTVGGFFPVPSTSSAALSSFNNVALIALTNVKAAAGRLHRIMIQNPNTSAAWLQVFNSATTGAVTLGTTQALYPVYVPASGYFEDFFEFSDGFSAGITIAATTTANGSTAVTTGLVVSLGYI